MDFEPFLGKALVYSHGLANAVDQDFSAAAGQASHACFLEPRQHFAKRYLVDFVKMPELRRAEGMQIDPRITISEVAQQIFVPFQFQARMHAALHENLVATQGDRLLDFLVEFLA